MKLKVWSVLIVLVLTTISCSSDDTELLESASDVKKSSEGAAQYPHYEILKEPGFDGIYVELEQGGFIELFRPPSRIMPKCTSFSICLDKSELANKKDFVSLKIEDVKYLVGKNRSDSFDNRDAYFRFDETRTYEDSGNTYYKNGKNAAFIPSFKTKQSGDIIKLKFPRDFRKGFYLIDDDSLNKRLLLEIR